MNESTCASKRCPKCGQRKPLSDFTPDKSKASGYSSRCKPCDAERSRDYYRRTGGEKARARYQANREQHIAQSSAARKARYAANPEAMRQYWREQDQKRPGRRHGESKRDPVKERIKHMRRHGGIDEWARLYEAQGGCCYLCGQTLEGVPQRAVVVDHDHDCHPPVGSNTESCGACRRGLAHGWCNQIIGLAGEDMGILRAIIANFERVNPETKQRIANRPHHQGELDLGIAL